MDRILAEKAAQLTYGEISGLIETDRGWTILQRLPRDFHSDAERLQLEAEQLSASGDVAAGIQNAQQALMIYPQYLRALNFIGVTFSQNGNPKKGAQVLASAAHLYPDDAGTKFLLASTFGLLKDDFQAGHNYEIAISLDPDFTAAYLNLGIVLYSRGDFSGAIKTLEDGLRINPLSADLYYNLGIALRTSGDEARAQQAINLARKLAPAPAQ
jgi:tetratricopeptide (TPR) repeat protein